MFEYIAEGRIIIKEENLMGKQRRQYWKKPMAVTLLLIFLVSAGSFGVTYCVNQMEEAKCFERLHEETGEMIRLIEKNAAADRAQLEILALIVAQYDDLASKELWERLDSYDLNGIMGRLELLLPDGPLLVKGGERIDVSDRLSFAQVAMLGAHITDRETDWEGKSEHVVRHYVPVYQDGEITAMLCGVIVLTELPENLILNPYGGEAALYIIDGKTGDFLVDTWHETTGNIWDLGEREMAPGYDHEQLKQGLIDGETGYVVFVSETVGEYLYFYYEPISINEWRVALSVPESAVFSSAYVIRDMLNVFLVFEATCFLLYFIWMFRYIRRETGEKQRQLDTINYIYDVEKLLFNAHERRENIDLALEKIAQMTSAEWVSFWLRKESGENILFQWNMNEKRIEDSRYQEEAVSFFYQYFQQGESQFVAKDAEDLKKLLPVGILEQIRNLAAVPIEDGDGGVCGVLLSGNMPQWQISVVPLKSVSISFGMFCRNMQSYSDILQRGETDLLTGLYNRNRYEIDLKKIKAMAWETITCFYIDANGLHELNNNRGHSAGDELLQLIAEQMQQTFGTQFAYRIGGDEFVVFAFDVDETTIRRCGKEFEEALIKREIYVSIGIQWEAGVCSVEQLIKAAEKNMYEVKKAYYERKNYGRNNKDNSVR